MSYLVFKTNLLVSILFTFATNYLSLAVFLTISFFFTTPLSLLKSRATVTSLSISNSSTSLFKLAKFDFSAKLKVSTSEIFLISVLLHN